MPPKDLDFSPLVSEVSQLTSVKDGMVAFVDDVAERLELAKDDPAQVQSVADGLKAVREALSAALVKGTAAASETGGGTTEPPVEPPVEPPTEPPAEGGETPAEPTSRRR